MIGLALQEVLGEPVLGTMSSSLAPDDVLGAAVAAEPALLCEMCGASPKDQREHELGLRCPLHTLQGRWLQYTELDLACLLLREESP